MTVSRVLPGVGQIHEPRSTSTSTVVEPTGAAPWRRAVGSSLTWLGVVLAAQIALALRPGTNRTAFEDEGLYVYFGHLVLDHLGYGTAVPGAPGSYFSGSPWLYPPLAAIGDSLGGLQGARAVSLLFAVVATVGTYGLARELFGARAGTIAAAVFALNGSVILQSHLATYDAMAMSLVALAAWLAAFTVRRDAPIWAPVVAGLLVLAFLAKYAAAVYTPIVGLVLLAAGWPRQRRRSVRRAALVVTLALLIAFWVLDAWGRRLLQGLVITTVDRRILLPGGRGLLTGEIVDWVGPWLVLAAVPVFVLREHWRVDAVLLLGSVIGPLEQVRIGEKVSLDKHVAFGLVFAAPLIGELFSWLIRHVRRAGPLLLAATLVNFSLLGLHYSRQFLTSWPDDTALVSVLGRDIAAAGPAPVLGENSAAERYSLRAVTTPAMWIDTFYFHYHGRTGLSAYVDAVDHHYFGVVYLDGRTGIGGRLQTYLATHDTPYVASASLPRLVRGAPAGSWTVYTLTSVQPHLPRGSS